MAFTTPYNSKQALKAYFAGLLAGWEMIHYTADEYIAQDDIRRHARQHLVALQVDWQSIRDAEARLLALPRRQSRRIFRVFRHGGPASGGDAIIMASDRMRIFVAGATGVIGKPLVRLLVDAGHEVVGTTRSAAKAGELARLGATPVVVDAFDAQP